MQELLSTLASMFPSRPLSHTSFASLSNVIGASYLVTDYLNGIKDYGTYLAVSFTGRSFIRPDQVLTVNLEESTDDSTWVSNAGSLVVAATTLNSNVEIASPVAGKYYRAYLQTSDGFTSTRSASVRLLSALHRQVTADNPAGTASTTAPTDANKVTALLIAAGSFGRPSSGLLSGCGGGSGAYMKKILAVITGGDSFYWQVGNASSISAGDRESWVRKDSAGSSANELNAGGGEPATGAGVGTGNFGAGGAVGISTGVFATPDRARVGIDGADAFSDAVGAPFFTDGLGGQGGTSTPDVYGEDPSPVPGFWQPGVGSTPPIALPSGSVSYGVGGSGGGSVPAGTTYNGSDGEDGYVELSFYSTV